MNTPYKGKFKVTQIFKGPAHDGLDLVGLDSKNIYSTVDGTVEVAGYENPSDKSVGFGLYVRIKQTGTEDRFYFGHLSKTNVLVGQKVNKGDLLGIEGNTGKSTGSHCHYCARTKGLKVAYLNIPAVSGIPNAVGTYYDDSKDNTPQKKTAGEIAREVIDGKWGNGEERKQRLTAAGYSYAAVQKEVNAIVNLGEKKSNEEIAREVVAGKWGNGTTRKEKLTKAGYVYATVQNIVNKLVKGGEKE